MSEPDLAKTRQFHEVQQTCVRDILRFIELNGFQGLHTPENFKASVSDLREAGIIASQLQTGDVFGRRIGSLAAVHARQALDEVASADMTESRVLEVDRC